MAEIVVICAAVIAAVAGLYGFGKVMFERGYVRGYEAATHPVQVECALDDDKE